MRIKTSGIRRFFSALLGRPLSAKEAEQIQRKMLKRGKERLESLFGDLNLLAKLDTGGDLRTLGRQLAWEIRKSSRHLEIETAVAREAEEIEARSTIVLAPRDAIILAARDALASKEGVDRRRLLQIIGGGAAATQMPVNVFFPPRNRGGVSEEDLKYLRDWVDPPQLWRPGETLEPGKPHSEQPELALEYWPIPWLGVRHKEDGTTVVFHSAIEYSSDDMDYEYSLPFYS